MEIALIIIFLMWLIFDSYRMSKKVEELQQRLDSIEKELSKSDPFFR